MINKSGFIGIIGVLENLSYRSKYLGQFVGRTLDYDEFPYNYIIDCIHALTDAFFEEEQLENNRCGTREFFYDCNPEFKLEWEAVRDIIYYFCITTEFGRSLEHDTDNILIVIDKEKGTYVSNYHLDGVGELYDLIEEWVTRTPEEYLIYQLRVPNAY